MVIVSNVAGAGLATNVTQNAPPDAVNVMKLVNVCLADSGNIMVNIVPRIVQKDVCIVVTKPQGIVIARMDGGGQNVRKVVL